MEMRDNIRRFLTHAIQSRRNVSLDLGIASFGEDFSTDIGRALRAISQKSAGAKGRPKVPLPKTIVFPYSRHSSYPEQCQLVDLFKPKDVWPCTVDVEAWMQDGKYSCRPLPTKLTQTRLNH